MVREYPMNEVEEPWPFHVMGYHMDSALNEAMNGVLNESTNTVHKHKMGPSEFETECGLTNHVGPDYLRRTSIEQALSNETTSKCGRCFPGAGGY